MSVSDKAAQSNSRVRRRLLDTALALFAEQGIGSVSIRTINAAAKSANQSAVHYHFGNKFGLIEALLDETLASWVSNEEEFFSALNGQAHHGPSQVRQLVAMLIAPIMMISMQPEGRQQIKFVARILSEGGPEGNQLLADKANPIIQKVNRVFYQALPAMDEGQLNVRVLFAISSALHLISDAGITKYWSLPVSEPQDLANPLVDYLAGGILQGAS